MTPSFVIVTVALKAVLCADVVLVHLFNIYAGRGSLRISLTQEAQQPVGSSTWTVFAIHVCVSGEHACIKKHYGSKRFQLFYDVAHILC